MANPNPNRDGLKPPFKKGCTESAPIQKLGGIARQKQQKERKVWRDLARELMAMKAPEKIVKKLEEQYGLDADAICNTTAMMLNQMRIAQTGHGMSSTGAAAFVRDTAGEKPVDEVVIDSNVANIDDLLIAALYDVDPRTDEAPD